MTAQSFYRVCAGLPLVVPAALLPMAQMGPASGSAALGMRELASRLVLASLLGGLPYLVLVALLLWRLRGRSAAAYRTTSMLAPLLFAALFFLAGLAVALSDPVLGVEGGLRVGLYYSAWCLVVGYFYAATTELLRWLLLRTRILRLEDGSEGRSGGLR